MVKFLTFFLWMLGLCSCGVKKEPTPLYEIPKVALTENSSPTPSPSPGK